jgi:hypothetical protein
MLTGNSEDSTDEIDFIGISIVIQVKFHRARPSRMSNFQTLSIGCSSHPSRDDLVQN